MSADMRIKRTALDRRRRSARVALAVFAVLALSLLPLRAWCDLEAANAAQTTGEHQAGGGDGKSDPCCASIEDIALVDSIVPALPAGSGTAPFVALLVSSFILSGFVVHRPRLAGAPPPSRSYYARSTRVLR
jgi:hypothetical protein